MAKNSLFPEEMLRASSENLTLESIASKLFYFEQHLQLIHWQTMSYAEHQAIGSLYEYVGSFRDGVVEKLMGYMKSRPKGLKVEPITDKSSITVVEDLCNFAYKLYEWAGENDYCDVENLAQELSGEAAKVKYLLTLS